MNRKKFGCLLLMFALVFVTFSTTLDVARAEEAETVVEDDIWEQINALENAALEGRRGAPAEGDYTAERPTEEFYAGLADQVEQTILASDCYIEGSLIRNGDNLYWQSTDGRTYGYIPSLLAETYEEPAYAASSSGDPGPQVLKNGQTFIGSVESITFDSDDVILFAPFYHIPDLGDYLYDENHYYGYAQECLKIRAATGGDCYVFTQTYATVTLMSKALESGGVVVYDGHGTTNWSVNNGSDIVDRTIEADTSYIILMSEDGVDDWDYTYVGGVYHNYPHAAAYTNSNGLHLVAVDGTVLAKTIPTDSMDKRHTFFWNVACYGAGTDGILGPLMEKGIDVYYSYRQDVGTNYDYDCKYYFWYAMENGATVADAADYMWVHGAWSEPCDWNRYNRYPHDPVDSYPCFVSANSFDYYRKVDAYFPPYSEWKLADLKKPGGDPGINPGGGGGGSYDPYADLPAYLRLDPMGLDSFPQASGYPRSYYRMFWDTHGYGDKYNHIHTYWSSGAGLSKKFLRFDWDVGNFGVPQKAYAVFACYNGYGDGVLSHYKKIHDEDDGYGSNYVLKDNYGELDEIHKACIRVEVDITTDEETGRLIADLPRDKSPDYRRHAEYYVNPILVTPDRCDIIFDHWEFIGNNGDPETANVTAKAVYYNRFDIRGWYNPVASVTAAITEEDGKLIATAIGRDQVTRTTVIPWVDGSKPNNLDFGGDAGCDCHYWIYDGVDHWETDYYNPVTGQGAWAYVKYHCVHGCQYNKAHPLTFKVPAKITSGNADDWNKVVTETQFEFTAFVGQNYYGPGVEMRGGADGWTRYEQTTVTKDVDPDLCEWEFVGFEWIREYLSLGNVNKNPAAVAKYEYKHVSGAVVETREVEATVSRADESRKHVYVASVSAEEALDNQPRTSDPEAMSSTHHWVFDYFGANGNSGLPSDIYARFHCDHCGNPFAMWTKYFSSSSGYKVVCGNDAPLVYEYLSAEDSIDRAAHQDIKVYGHSAEEWTFSGFKWKAKNGVRAFATYLHDMSGEPDVDTALGYLAAMPDSEKYELIQNDEGFFLKYMVEVTPQPVNTGRPGMTAFLPKYRAAITAEDAPDGLPNEETKLVIPGIDPDDQPTPVDPGEHIENPQEKHRGDDMIIIDNFIFKPFPVITNP